MIKATKLGPGTLTLGESGDARDLHLLVSNALLEPDISDSDPLVVLSGDELDDSEVNYRLKGEMYQDIEDGMTSNLVWFWEHDGDVVPFTFRPRNDHDLAWDGELTVRPVAIGGDVKTRNTSSFDFRCNGKPIPSAPDTP